VMDLLMELEKQALGSGGRVIVLLGNHEMMNLMGDLRDVSTQAYLGFADENSEKRRRKAYRDELRLYKRRKPVPGQSAGLTPEFEEQWKKAHPLGFLEYRTALEPKGEYGQWLRERPVTVQIGDTIFLHGGLHPELVSWKLEAINQRVKNEIQGFDRYSQYMVRQSLILPFFTLNQMIEAAQTELGRQKRSTDGHKREKMVLLEDFLRFGNWLSVHPDGPLWFRGFALWREKVGARHLSGLLSSYDAEHFVVGHTPQLPGGIQVRFEGKVFLIDTGMLSSFYPGGRPSALEVQDGRFTAVYTDQRKVLLDPEPAPLLSTPAQETR